ncbi:MAG: response regulator [Opitutales bacterium]
MMPPHPRAKGGRNRLTTLGHLSHEVRTHLQGILGLVGWLRASPLSNGQRAAIGRLEAGGHSLLSLVNSLLEPGISQPREFIPAEITEDVVALLAPAAQARGVEVICAADPDRQAACGNAEDYRKVAMNLVGNAVKFTHRGQIVVQLDAQPARKMLRLKLTVSDSGIGINPTDRRRIFAQRFQVRAGEGGSGLGLPLARSLARAMRGDVRVAASDGGGSVFSATLRLERAANTRVEPKRGQPCLIVGGHTVQRRWLAEMLLHRGVPCAESTPERARTAAEALARSTGEKPLVLLDLPVGSTRPTKLEPRTVLLHPLAVDPGPYPALAKPLRGAELLALLDAPGPACERRTRSGRRILLIDDDPVARAVTARQLERQGHRVSAVSDARAARRQLGQGQWDLAILDLELPEVNGTELARDLRRRLPDLPLLALTGHAGPEARARCLRAGFSDHVAKPTSEAKLAEVVRRLAEQGDMDKQDRATARRILLGSIDDECSRLEQAALSGRTTDIGEAAHRARGALLTAGLGHLAELAALAEREANGGQARSAVRWLRKLSGGLRRLAG